MGIIQGIRPNINTPQQDIVHCSHKAIQTKGGESMILRLLLLYLYYFIPWETVRDTGELVSPIPALTLCRRIGINILRIVLFQILQLTPIHDLHYIPHLPAKLRQPQRILLSALSLLIGRPAHSSPLSWEAGKHPLRIAYALLQPPIEHLVAITQRKLPHRTGP